MLQEAICRPELSDLCVPLQTMNTQQGGVLQRSQKRLLCDKMGINKIAPQAADNLIKSALTEAFQDFSKKILQSLLCYLIQYL